MQRFGRIDRVGSRNESVQLINFWPVDDLDQYIGVKHRVEACMAFANLSHHFDQQTQDGKDRRHYDVLLDKALASIEHTFQRRAASSLLHSRGGILPTANAGEFDLVAWLVIKQP